MLLVLALGFGGIGCSAQLGQRKPNIVTAQDGGKEEVLSDGDEDRDDFGRPKASPDTVAGEFMVVLGYIGMIIGSAILPFLLL